MQTAAHCCATALFRAFLGRDRHDAVELKITYLHWRRHTANAGWDICINSDALSRTALSHAIKQHSPNIMPGLHRAMNTLDDTCDMVAATPSRAGYVILVLAISAVCH